MRCKSASYYVETPQLKGFWVNVAAKYLMETYFQWGNFKVPPKIVFELPLGTKL